MLRDGCRRHSLGSGAGVLTLPAPRGETSAALVDALRGRPGTLAGVPLSDDDPLRGEDLHLALYLIYELHYRGLPGVDDGWEWDPALLRLRAELEARFAAALEEQIGAPSDGVDPTEMDLALRAIADADETPSVSTFIERSAEVEHVREFVIHRSAYQLKEADPHSFALARLWGPPKAAMVTIQADEYGGGRPDRIHAQLFANAMEALGLDSRYGFYLDAIPGVTLATVNLMSMLALHRNRRGAITGHLALFEMTSSLPNSRYARGLRRLGFAGAALEFFDEHVEADAVHENLAAVDLAGGLARQQPELAPDILWGARALVDVEARWARHLMEAWEAGHSSLLHAGGVHA
jgi:Iron-containing redox enzyme